MREEWVWDGGRSCLDLVNTLRDRWASGRELLRMPADLSRWLHGAGLVSSPVRVMPAELESAREIREAVDRAVRAVAKGERMPRASALVVNQWPARRGIPRLRTDARGVPRMDSHAPDGQVSAAFAIIAIDAMELLTSDAVTEVRVCESDTCGIRFLDRSPARNRQWCSMSRCGNREKARQHYARSKVAQGERPPGREGH